MMLLSGNPRLLLLVAVVAAASVTAELAVGQSVIIEVNDTSSDSDDYLCWTPVLARARFAEAMGGPVSAPGPHSITLISEGKPGGGVVQFQSGEGDRPTRDSFAPSASITLTLPSDGKWVRFWVAGAHPSRAEKDVSIAAKREDGEILGRLPLMVRMRKNANALTSFEAQVFLSALLILHDVENGSANSEYSPFARIHEAANDLQIHRSPLFLPWHRALVLDLERRLQEIDARVSVPYWRFDQTAQNVFTGEFMGITTPNAEFAPGDGLARWSDPALGSLIRDPSKAPAEGLIDAGIPALFNQSYLIFRGQLESRFHVEAHRQLGGWLATSASPADPVFFLLHANVDRVWAHWQAKNDRFDPANELSYSSQGRYPGVGPDMGRYAPGVYAEDGMWPWTYAPGAASTGAVWPPVDHKMPLGSMGLAAQAPVTPASQIDYLDVRGTGSYLGYCYDDIDFTGATPSSSQ